MFDAVKADQNGAWSQEALVSGKQICVLAKSEMSRITGYPESA
jgi:hypothetical protein